MTGPIRLTLYGEACSKANSREIVTNPRTKRPMVIKSKKARAYERDVVRTLPKLPDLLRGRLKFTATIYYASERPDLDESLILDVLQGHIYVNDRQVREKHIFHDIDRHNPRAEIVIEPKGAA